MLLEIKALINAAQLEKIHELLTQSQYVDGKVTAGKAAAQVKNNLESSLSAQQQQLLNRILMASLGNHAQFKSFALPNRMADFIFSRYETGMTYGDHTDDAIMGGAGGRFRTDVSMTVFLNEPDTYEGGELVVRTPFGDKRVKLNAGDAVVYPSASVHHVAEVTSGVRQVALTWMQSYVRDAAQRELLFELDQAREKLLADQPQAQETKYVDRCYSNLLRMWADV
ncbi:MAG: Fe2+-dependent dioxygenase [Chromatiales bacterium]|jgi:PKHD-type hydroxylase